MAEFSITQWRCPTVQVCWGNWPFTSSSITRKSSKAMSLLGEWSLTFMIGGSENRTGVGRDENFLMILLPKFYNLKEKQKKSACVPSFFMESENVVAHNELYLFILSTKMWPLAYYYIVKFSCFPIHIFHHWIFIFRFSKMKKCIRWENKSGITLSLSELNL